MPRSSILRRFSVFVRTKCEMWQSIKALTPPPNTFPLYRPTRIFRTRIDRSVFQKIGWHHQRIIPVVAYRNRAWHNPELWQPWWEAQWNSPQWFGIKKKKRKGSSRICLSKEPQTLQWVCRSLVLSQKRSADISDEIYIQFIRCPFW